mgnify:FL=1
MVFLFTETPNDDLAGLAKQLDKLVVDNEEKKLAVVMNFTGEPTDEYTESIAKFGEKHNLKNVTLTVTGDAEKFKISDEAEVTVMHYKDKKVAFNLAVKPGGLKEDAIKKIVEGTSKIIE